MPVGRAIRKPSGWMPITKKLMRPAAKLLKKL
jgi:hypothetical protein